MLYYNTIDIFYLLKKYSLTEMLGFYSKKYDDGNEYLVLKSLTYFDDADTYEEPEMLIKTDWNHIKSFITETVKKTT
jgi:hypothetical protein